MSRRCLNHQRGLGAIAAIVVLVLLALLASAIVAVGSSQQMTTAQDVLSARAWQAARAGNEWGVYKALKSLTWTSTAGQTCDTASRSATLDLSAQSGFYVTVSCDSWSYNEGETESGAAVKVRVYRITAVACPDSAGCPVTGPAAAGSGYVERTRQVLATDG